MKNREYYLLENFLEKIPNGKVLDLGCGNGRNSLFLARRGFSVHAIDIDSKIIKNLKQESKKEKLKINIIKADIRKFPIKENTYDLILAINSLIFMKKSELQKIITKIKNGAKNNGVVIISGFTTKDSSYLKLKKRYQPIEKNAFKDSNKQYWQFFSKNELKSYFLNGFEILFYSERNVKDSIPYSHTHGIAEIVAKKRH
jgi:2-polyprenyl-3-methyl-5-hydroxy-6-metoxy-1,4-benzoquinol methylase